MSAPPTWEPGDPLYPRHGSGVAGNQYRLYLFNFRDDAESEDCHCADAASWPLPRNRPLPDGDELADFIAAYHRDQEATA